MTSLPSSAAAHDNGVIRVRGARVHNLKNVDLDLPHDRLIVITGVSGSGKSSLAFDTIAAEGQRQYIESLSLAARQFFKQVERPDVDLIEGLPPTIAIDQRGGSHHPRSTVATITEIYDYLRLLMARLGEPVCYRCGTSIRQQSPEQIRQRIGRLPSGTKAMILAPVVRGQSGNHDPMFAALRRSGLVRVRVNGVLHELDDPPELPTDIPHHIEGVVDRIVVRGNDDEKATARWSESIDLALKLANGVLIVSSLVPSTDTANEQWHDQVFNTQFVCPKCGLAFEEIEPRTFSFNCPYGACPTCQGLGKIESTAGDNDADNRCADCGGGRLRPEARAVRLGGKTIVDIGELPLDAAASFFNQLIWNEDEAPIADRLVSEIVRRLEYLSRIGVTYLTLNRPIDTLSGGELQRVRMATCIGSGLVGACYVLDEPSIGLHPRDNERLISAIRELQLRGNTVIVVEHDPAIMQAADWLVDVGPGPGARGGHVVAQGTVAHVMADPNSLTGAYLSDRERIATRGEPRPIEPKRMISLEGATANNLQNVDVQIPLRMLTCITGVSGSGKTSLIHDTLARAIARRLTNSGEKPGPHRALHGAESIDKLIVIDTAPIGRTPRSNPATYSGLFDDVRQVFAATREAKRRGYRSARFSFNAPGGRCEACQGYGYQKIETKYLPELFVPCAECHGARFNRATLEVRFKGRSIAEVLAMSVDDAVAFFSEQPSIATRLAAMVDVGLGYLSIGQPATTLSGGEAQRVKLATELARADTGNTLYILDEPTTGLHMDDTRRLIAVLSRLVDAGNTVLVIEHNLDLIATADWVIDLGPEGGAVGGQIIATGPPAAIAAHPTSHTGRFLRAMLRE